MSKRPRPSDESEQPIKKQINSKLKARHIRSSSSERTLQLLYQGINNLQDNCPKDEILCTFCVVALSTKMVCCYCERIICTNCTNVCFYCQSEFCANCSFPTYDHKVSACYSCYK